MKSLKVFVLTLGISSMMGCSTTQQTVNQTKIPFPILNLQENPRDPLGFCLSKEDAAELALYIRTLQRQGGSN